MKIRKYFITGILVLLPVVATVYILFIIFNAIDSIIRPLIKLVFGGPVFGLGFVLTILVIVGVGAFATNVLGSRIIKFAEKVFMRIPIIRPVYMTVKQFLDALTLNNKTAFKEVVLLEYPRRGIFQVGFLTFRGEGVVESKTGEKMLTVFVPTTPNPTSGVLVFVPETDIHYLDVSIEEGLKMILSAGVYTPISRAGG